MRAYAQRLSDRYGEHDCGVVSYETMSNIARDGSFTVYEYCECGALVGTFEDSVL